MLRNICFTISAIAVFGVILCSGSINTPLFVCLTIAVISFGIGYAIEEQEYIKDRIAYMIAQIIIAYRKYNKER